MSGHSHYGEYADAGHGHRGEYAPERHDHDLDYAGKYHQHYDLVREDRSTAQLAEAVRNELVSARRELDGALSQIRDLEAANTELAEVLRQVADRYTQAYLTGEVGDAHRAIADELAAAFHTLAGALGSKRGRQ